LDRRQGGRERMPAAGLLAVVVALREQLLDVVAGAEGASLAGHNDAARVEPLEREAQRLQQRAIQRAPLVGVGDRQQRDARRRLLDVDGAGHVRYSSTTSVSPSETAWPSSQRISFTTPGSSASTGISI